MHRFLFITSLIFAIACSSTVEKKDEKSEQTEYQKSREDRSMGYYDIPPFKNDEAEDFYFKGNKARQAGEFELANEYFLKSYYADPTHVVNINNLANSYLYLDKTSEAMFYLEQAFSLDSAAGISYANFTNFAIYTKKYADGIRIGRRGLVNTKDSMALGIVNINLAILFAYTDECDSASSHLQKAVEYKEHLDARAVMSVEEEIAKKCN